MSDQQTTHDDEVRVKPVIAQPELSHESQAVAAVGAAQPSPRRPPRPRFNERGQIITPNQAEMAEMAEGIKQMFEEIRKIPNAPGEDDRDFYRAMDSLRPDRPLFAGLY